MKTTADTALLEATAARAFERRTPLIDAVAAQADEVAAACRDLAARFHRGGRLLVFGNGSAATDAAHVAVEFVHPVIVGKRALPSIALSNDAAGASGVTARVGSDEAHAHRLRQLGRPDDIALGVSPDGRCANVARALEVAAEQGMLTVAMTGGDGGVLADRAAVHHTFAVPSGDPRVVKEGHVTLYHVLWELVHVFLDQPDTGGGAPAEGVERLYPFLYEGESDPGAVLAEVRHSTREKAAEIGALRDQLAETMPGPLAACAADLASSFADGGTLFTFGNGGSSTDAQAVASEFLDPRADGARALPAMSLTDDVAVLTALSNDVGFEVVFSRQLAGLARAGDTALGLSTSGNSPNVIRAFEAARQGGVTTIGLAGYDGGAMADCDAVDHLFVVPSSSVHRIQEAQTTLYHLLWELTRVALSD